MTFFCSRISFLLPLSLFKAIEVRFNQNKKGIKNGYKKDTVHSNLVLKLFKFSDTVIRFHAILA